MRIILVNKYWHIKGGAERVLFDTKELLESAGHTVEVFGMKDEKNIFENKYFIDYVDYRSIKGFKKIKVFKDLIYNKQAKINFRKLIKDFKPDVIHFHNIYHQLSFSLIDVVKEEKISSVMTLHDYKMISPNYSLFHHGKIQEECKNGKYYNCILKNCLENWSWSFVVTLEAYYRKIKKFDMYINMYISPSEFLKNKFEKFGFKGKIKVIANPLNSSVLRKGVVSREEGKGILYFGRLSKEKGLDSLLKTAKLTPEVNYRIAGNGPDLENLKNHVKQNNLNNVEFLGFLNKKELETEIVKSRLVVVPSIWYENYPMNVLESLQLGKLVIASKIGGLVEMLPKELLFEANNPQDLAKTVKLWYNKPFKELEELGQKLKKKAEQTSDSDKYLKNLLSIYEEIQRKK